VLGAGFGGLELTTRLSAEFGVDVDITLIDQSEGFVFDSSIFPSFWPRPRYLRYRPEPFQPGRPSKVEFILPDAFHTFRKGHRLMVQVQSSWFPLVDRNPQRFVDIYQARDGDFRAATHRVYRGGRLGSRISVQVLP